MKKKNLSKKLSNENGSGAVKAILIIIIILIMLGGIAFCVWKFALKGKNNQTQEQAKQEESQNIENPNEYLKYVSQTTVKDSEGENQTEKLYINIEGKTLVLTDAEESCDINHEVYVSRKDSKYGLKDIKGNMVIDYGTYDNISSFTYSNYRYGKYMFGYDVETGYFRVKSDNKEGVVDYKGNVIIKPEYDFIFCECQDVSNMGERSIYFSARKKQEDGSYKHSIINNTGVEVARLSSNSEYLSSDYDVEKKILNDGIIILALTNEESNKTSVINVTGNELIGNYSFSTKPTSSYAKKAEISQKGNALIVDIKKDEDADVSEKSEIYFFGEDNKKKNKLTQEGDYYPVIDNNSDYYIIDIGRSGKKLYNKRGELIKDIDGSLNIISSNNKTYFSKENTEGCILYDESFKEIDKGSSMKFAWKSYLKDGVLYDYSGNKIIDNVRYLYEGSNISSEHDTYDYITTNDGKSYITNGKKVLELQKSYSDRDVIGYNNKYIIITRENDKVIYELDTFKELGKFSKTEDIYTYNNYNVVKMGDNYYDYRGNLIETK